MNSIEQEELSDSSLEKIIALVYKLTGISMGSKKKTLVQGRLRPRIRELGLDNYEGYLTYLASNKGEIQEFINLVTTNETSFFRTQRVWDYFNKDFLPNWKKDNPRKILRIWSAASSSGEEAYSIGICCEEYKLNNPGFDYQIFGTDISSDVLITAERGKYSGRSIELFKKSNRSLFDKYMEPDGDVFKVKPEVKSKIRFGVHNLFQLPKDHNFFDIIFLRNVLIYFEPSDIEKVLSNIANGLVPHGTLVIGESESLSSLKTSFKYKLPLIYEKMAENFG